jgi:predicted RNase H-like HicB family nuclease
VDLTVEVRAEGAGYWARVVELPGCLAAEMTLRKLAEALGEAIGLYLWDRPASLGHQALREGRFHVSVEEPP